MKTKYNKVSVSARLPDNDGDYFTDQGNLSFKVKTKDWYYAEWRHNHKVEFWLQEVTDYEDEMKEMLEFIYGYGEKVEWSKVRPKLEELLTKLKTES